MSELVTVHTEKERFRGMVFERHWRIETPFFVFYYDYSRRTHTHSISLRTRPFFGTLK